MPGRPAVVIWLKIYALVMLLVQGAITFFFARVLFDPAGHLKGEIAYQNNPEGAVGVLLRSSFHHLWSAGAIPVCRAGLAASSIRLVCWNSCNHCWVLNLCRLGSDPTAGHLLVQARSEGVLLARIQQKT